MTKDAKKVLNIIWIHRVQILDSLGSKNNNSNVQNIFADISELSGMVNIRRELIRENRECGMVVGFGYF